MMMVAERDFPYALGDFSEVGVLDVGVEIETAMGP